MTTWAALDAQLITMLGSAITHDSDTRAAWINSALKQFAEKHTARTQTVSYDGDGSVQSFTLPSDYISIYSVYSEQEEMFFEPLPDIAGVAWDTEPDPALSVKPYSWQEWPQGTLYLTYAPPDITDAIVVKYFGHWPEVEDSDGPIHPVWAEEAVNTLAVAASYIPSFSDMSFLNEFRTRVDSGNPMHNPIIQGYDALIKRYEWLLTNRPRQMREPYFTKGGRHR